MNAIAGEPSDGGATAILAAVGADDDGGGDKAKLEELEALIIQMNDVFAAGAEDQE